MSRSADPSRSSRIAILLAALAAPVLGAAAATDGAAVRGVIRAEAAATISSELVARVTSLPFKPGQAFHVDEVLLRFDCRRYEADFRAAEAEVRMQAITVDTNRQLLKHRATGSNDLALAEAKHAQAVATMESLKVRVSQCVIAAPYDGRVVERIADIAEMPQANAPLLKIVKTGQLEIELIVPSTWAVWLQTGTSFAFKVDETGTTHAAHIMHSGAVIDPVSQTMKVTAVLVDADAAVRPGMSGSALLTPPAKGSD